MPLGVLQIGVVAKFRKSCMLQLTALVETVDENVRCAKWQTQRQCHAIRTRKCSCWAAQAA